MPLMKNGGTVHDDHAVPLGDRIRGPSRTDWRKSCGAMAQQQGDATAQSTPQKFVHLVGYRDPSTKPVRR
jgi:hypothetical protein